MSTTRRLWIALGLLLGAVDAARILTGLGLQETQSADDDDSDRLIILRHTLMNPFLIDRENGISYIDLYFYFLAARVRALTDAVGEMPT